MAGKYKSLRLFKKHLQNKLKIKGKIKLILKKNADCLRIINDIDYDISDNVEWIVYGITCPQDRRIALPMLLEKRHLLITLGHEIVHIWQCQNNMELDEEQADSKAEQLFNEWKGAK